MGKPLAKYISKRWGWRRANREFCRNHLGDIITAGSLQEAAHAAMAGEEIVPLQVTVEELPHRTKAKP